MIRRIFDNETNRKNLIILYLDKAPISYLARRFGCVRGNIVYHLKKLSLYDPDQIPIPRKTDTLPKRIPLAPGISIPAYQYRRILIAKKILEENVYGKILVDEEFCRSPGRKYRSLLAKYKKK